MFEFLLGCMCLWFERAQLTMQLYAENYAITEYFIFSASNESLLGQRIRTLAYACLHFLSLCACVCLYFHYEMYIYNCSTVFKYISNYFMRKQCYLRACRQQCQWDCFPFLLLCSEQCKIASTSYHISTNISLGY